MTPPVVASARHLTSRSSGSSSAGSGSDIDIPNSTPQQQQQQQHHRDPVYRYSSLAAGIASGIVSSLVVAPLDLIRTRLQVFRHPTPNISSSSSSSSNSVGATTTAWRMLRDILQKEGFKGCFRGLTATLLTVPVFWGVYCA